MHQNPKLDRWFTKTIFKQRIIAKQRRLLARSHYQSPDIGNRRKLIIATTILALSARTLQNQHHSVNFDTDSHPIGVDNRCTACISHDINDFIGKLKDSN